MGALFLCALGALIFSVFWMLYIFTVFILSRGRRPRRSAYDRIEAEKLLERSEDAERRRRLGRR